MSFSGIVKRTISSENLVISSVSNVPLVDINFSERIAITALINKPICIATISVTDSPVFVMTAKNWTILEQNYIAE